MFICGGAVVALMFISLGENDAARRPVKLPGGTLATLLPKLLSGELSVAESQQKDSA
jgi:hypothetical protein